MTTDCVLVAELGPNPAPLAEALWALTRQRGLRVREAFVLTSARGAHYLQREVLAPGAAFDQLREALGGDLVPRELLHVVVVHGAAGEALDDERTPEEASAWNESRWQNARAAMRAAGDVPVVFALTGGRLRTSSAVTTVVFQLLARSRDMLVDVRVGDRRVEGARAAFWFPEQRAQRLMVAEGTLLARDVAVHLVDLLVPRLRRLLGGRELASWTDALEAGRRAVEDVPTVSLALDVAHAKLSVNDAPVTLSEAEFVWFAALVLTRKRGVDEGWLRSDDLAAPRAVLEQMRRARGEAWRPVSGAWVQVLLGKEPNPATGAALRKQRSTAVARFVDALASMGLPRAAVRSAQPEREVRHVGAKKVTCWRLPIEPANITVV